MSPDPPKVPRSRSGNGIFRFDGALTTGVFIRKFTEFNVDVQ
jgi:hypothetical protein